MSVVVAIAVRMNSRRFKVSPTLSPVNGHYPLNGLRRIIRPDRTARAISSSNE